MGFTDEAKVYGESITISARGTIGYVKYRNYNYYPVVRLLCLKTKEENILTKYLYYCLRNMKFTHVTTGIPSLTSKMIESVEIPSPTLKK